MSNVMISNPADRKKIKDALQEISDAMTRIAAEKDLIKEIVADVSDNFQMEKKTVNKMARVYHKQYFINEQQAATSRMAGQQQPKEAVSTGAQRRERPGRAGIMKCHASLRLV